MEDDYVNEQFKTINAKLDKLTELTQQTALQEYRLTKLEESIQRMQEKKENNTWKWLTPVISSVVAAVMSFVIAGGLKG